MKSDLVVILLLIFAAECARGIVMPSLGVGILQQGGQIEDIGVAVSLFSVGRLFLAVPYGYWAEKRSSSLEVFIGASLVSIIGNFLYWMFAGQEGDTPLRLVLFSRFLVGMGTSILGVARGYLASHSTIEHRTRLISYSALFQFMGFALSPALGSVSHGGTLYGLPGGVMILVNLLLIGLLFKFVPSSDLIVENQATFALEDHDEDDSTRRRRYDGDTENSPTIGLNKSNNDNSQRIEMIRLESPLVDETDHDSPRDGGDALEQSLLSNTTTTTLDKEQQQQKRCIKRIIQQHRELLLFMGFFFLNVVLRGILANVETFAPLQLHQLRSSPTNFTPDSNSTIDTQEVVIIGEPSTNNGGGGVVDEYFLILGVLGCLVFLVLDKLIKKGIADYRLLGFGISSLTLGLLFLVLLENDAHEEVNWTDWARFYLGTVLVWSVSSPICQTLTISIVSRLLGGKPQAVWLSWLTAAGSLGRIIFPLFGAKLSVWPLFWLQFRLCLVSLTIVLTISSRRFL